MIPLLHETDGWIAADKPAGMVVVPARGSDPDACAWRALERQRGERLWVVHRIDRDTSGVLVFARDAATHRRLSIAFQEARVRKLYRAWTRGAPRDDGAIDTPLRPARRGKMQPAHPDDPGARPSRTEYRVRRRWSVPAGEVAEVEVAPRSGRQHQIRVHLRSIGTPLLIDPLYGGHAAVHAHELGGSGDAVVCARLTLHAWRLEVPAASPAEETVRVEAVLPADLLTLVATLDRSGDSGSRFGVT